MKRNRDEPQAQKRAGAPTAKGFYYMTVSDFLAGYAPGTVLVACVVAACVELLKRTVLKKYVNNPLVSFLPFILGVAVYAAYYCIVKLSFEVFLEETWGVIRNGFAVGCLATLLSALVDKACGKTKLSGKALVVRELLEGTVPSDKLDSLAEQVAQLVSADGTEEDEEKVFSALREALSSTDGKARSSEELYALAKLIVATVNKTT